MHPNDTLQGRLLPWERESEKSLRGKLGYWRMVEERMVRAEIAKDGGDPNNSLEVARRIEQNHASDENYAQTSARISGRALAQQAAFLRDAIEEETRDAAIEVLRQIADGHNDARALARSFLDRCQPP